MSFLRRRRTPPAAPAALAAAAAPAAPPKEPDLPPHVSFYCAKRCILSALGVVYFFAFYAAYRQNVALLGEDGLAPFRARVERSMRDVDVGRVSLCEGVARAPHLWWVLDRSDANLDRVARWGMAAAALAALGAHAAPVFAALWVAYFTIVAAGEASTFYSRRAGVGARGGGTAARRPTP